MSITTTTLTRGAATAAVAAGLIFIGVQVGHPHLDAESVTTTEVAIRTFLKIVMVGLALVGITGMYLRQVTRAGVLGLVGYLVYSAGYLLILSTTSLAVYVLPEVAGSRPGYVDDVLAVATGGSADGDIGLLATVFQLQGFAYLAGGLVFGIALFRARVLSRWASALLAVSGLVSALLTVMPDAFYRLLAFPNGIAMIALGLSLWRSVRPGTTVAASTSPSTSATVTSTAGAR
jgi:hypothetical protein